MLNPEPNTHHIRIKPRSGWLSINWRELLYYKDLFYFLVQRDIKVIYKQTIVGFGWAFLRPFLTMVVLSLVFGKLAKVPSDGVPYPIFSFVALVPWIYFSTSMTKSTNSLLGNMNLLTKVYVPRLLIPLTPIIAGLLDFFMAFLMIVGFMVWYSIIPTINILFLPLLILMMILTASGVGLFFSSLSVRYRDVRFVVPFLSQLLMYAAPVAWPASLIPEKYRIIYSLYPMAGVVEGFRSALLGTNPMPWDLIGPGMITAIGLTCAGSFYFQQVEKSFADVA